jgi:hypothetical protein
LARSVFARALVLSSPFHATPHFRSFDFDDWYPVVILKFKINLCFTRYSGLMHCGTRNDPFYTNHNDATHQNTIAYNRIERIP